MRLWHRPVARLSQNIQRDCNGAAATIFALALPVVLGVAAVAVDLSNLYLAERRLQGIADAAAAAAVGGDIAAGGRQKVQAMITQSGEANVSISKFVPGHYKRDAAVAFDQRFTPNDPAVNAVRINLRQQVPLFFGQIITGKNTSAVSVEATAARDAMVAFELGTQLATLPGGLSNTLLSLIAGVNLGLTQDDITALANAKVDVRKFAQALRARNANGSGTLEDSLDKRTSLKDVIGALSDTTSGSAAVTLGKVAQLTAKKQVAAGDVVDLGPWGGSELVDARLDAKVEVYSLLRSLLEASAGKSYHVELDANVAGAASTRVRIAGGNGFARSPWLTLDKYGDMVLRTAETRIGLDVEVGKNLLGPLANLRIPLYVEIASAEARISNVSCNGPVSAQSVTVAAKPGIGTVAIADYNVADFANFSKKLPLKYAELVSVLLLISVDGFAEVPVGGNQTHSLTFTRAQIDALTRKQAGTQDVLTAAIGSLISRLGIKVKLLGLGLGIGLSDIQILGVVTNALTTLTPGLDTLVNQLTGILGVKLGVAEVATNGLSCGQPMIVG